MGIKGVALANKNSRKHFWISECDGRKKKMEGSEIPIVKFCSENLRSGMKEWVFTREKVREALEEYGCFVALYDTVSMELSSNMLGSLKQLFDVPLERKIQNVSEKPYHGYFGQNPLMPIHESMGIEHPILPTNIHSFTNLMWPSRGNKPFWYIYIYIYISIILYYKLLVLTIFYDLQ